MKIQILLVLAVTICGVFSSADIPTETVILDNLIESNKSTKDIFRIWHLLYKKEYQLDSKEAVARYANFKQKLKIIKAHNANKSNTYQKGLNQFSDLTKFEFQNNVLSKNLNFKYPNETVFNANGYYMSRFYFTASDSPATWKTVNWTVQCGKVWDQNPCGCCYAFSMVNAIECNYNIKKGVLPQLSRQQIVDCNVLTHGCHGGDPSTVAFYSKSQGLMSDKDYPFKAEEGTCAYVDSKSTAYLDGLETITSDETPQVYQTSHSVYNMLTRGAVAISLDADALDDYKTGITELNGCQKVNHAVLLIGYGEENGKKYWLIKNSWNTWWGEKGYVRVLVKDDSQGNCFIYQNAYRPFKN
jgi:C1A family cysteine protease